MDVEQAITSRRSCRRFVDRPVDKSLIEEVCRLATLAPSAINLQPWLLTAVMGPELPRLSRQLLKAFKEQQVGCAAEATAPLDQRYLDRQRLLTDQMRPAIKATDSPWSDFINEGSLNFYGAPAALIVSGESGLAHEARLDLGLALGWLLLACQEKGLATCPIGLVSRYSPVIQEALNLPPNRPVILALALGYADPEAPVNQVKTDRVQLEEVIRWYL
ncbi:MAG: nitroreductase family protein [Deltaproteobacteria bacterium]|nr:nitroreductase family protein [Deltaproteobacteria bacterium]